MRVLMYKKKSKVLQRMKEHGWTVGKLGVPTPTKKDRVGKQSVAKRRNRKFRQMPCPECGASIPRVAKLVQLHFLKSHRQLTEPEAFRIASLNGTKESKVPKEETTKHPFLVSGGLPSLGKRR